MRQQRANARQIASLDKSTKAMGQGDFQRRLRTRKEKAFFYASGHQVFSGVEFVEGKRPDFDVTFGRIECSRSRIREQLV